MGRRSRRGREDEMGRKAAKGDSRKLDFVSFVQGAVTESADGGSSESRTRDATNVGQHLDLWSVTLARAGEARDAEQTGARRRDLGMCCINQVYT